MSANISTSFSDQLPHSYSTIFLKDMRLLHTTRITVVEFIGAPPPYAILSHRWEDEEVTLRDLVNGRSQQMKGYEKLRKSCTLASDHGFEYIWIDTCCIDKSSSAELSEAINSMFKWYQDAVICYAFLSDVSTSTRAPATSRQDLYEITTSQWFTRGWTLQELIAPRAVHFYSQQWDYLGSRNAAAEAIQLATGISTGALLGQDLLGISIYQRMRWASTRTTTRPEDMAYCLLGIFDVNIPLLYGEGKKKAFQRLQEEILRKSTDLSLFLWTIPREEDQDPDLEFRGLLAEDPSWFSTSGFYGFDESLRQSNSGITSLQDTAMAITNKGISVQWTIMPVPADPARTLHLAMLAGSGDITGGIVIQQLDQEATQFCRVLSDKVIWLIRSGDIAGVLNYDLLGSTGGLLSASLDSGPRSFYVSPHSDSSNKPSLLGVGFSFTRHKCIEGKSSLKEFWAEKEGPSVEFCQDFVPGSSTWVARFRPEQISELFKTSGGAGASKALGALAISVKARTSDGTYMYKAKRDHCVVVGVDILPQTVIGTTNTFLEPWIVNTDEASPEEAIRDVDRHLEPRMCREADVGEGDCRCSLRKLTRVTGLWYDIRIALEGKWDD
ncbi:HET domain-containing protein [Fusarium keratoplasticum]|uniref:HET domain-containing protein n=1 Tax=Fusarium keratoplasticum TaxID=1328300 RepID=A0ACC0QNF3_9HYPO|nr:HET domain-containing protein [Fusarium keratoplasticum]KAI8660251.1 HET domain-containing protein [Fusarium keratoplasticum]KAI8661273.1 HET domain-containing protein [Fusarium keratoplasticum]